MNFLDILFMKKIGKIKPDAGMIEKLWWKKMYEKVWKLVTILGNPLSFLAKKAQTAVSTKVTLEPVQDLHGYNNPWPEGGGYNLWNEEWELGGIDSITGEDVQSTEQIRTKNPININGITELYAFNGSFPTSGTYTNFQCRFYDENDTYIGDVNVSGNIPKWNVSSGSYRPSVPTGATKVKFQLQTSYGTEYKNDICINTSSASVNGKYYPYSNICPISGRSSVSLNGCGTTVWNEEWEPGSYNSSSGNKTNSTSRIRNKNLISVTPSTSYGVVRPTSSMNIYEYGIDGTYLGIYSSIPSTNIYTTSDKTYYINFNVGSSSYPLQEYNNDISINYPATDTSYHAYQQSNDVTITFGETVYGGTLDVETGELVVDRKLITIGDYSWAYTSAYGVFRLDIPNIADSGLLTICSMLKTVTSSLGNMPDYSIRGGISTQPKRIYVKLPSDITTSRGLIDAIGDGTICYELATPSTIQLTPEQIQILKGQNTIWIEDEGATIELTYRA